MLVMNADILTKLDMSEVLDFHSSVRTAMTMCVRKFEYQIPYGVIEIRDNAVVSIDEKPSHQSIVSAGINVISPEAWDVIPSGRPFDVPDLMRALYKKGLPVSSFPVEDYWLDIGRLTDLEKAREDFENLF